MNVLLRTIYYIVFHDLKVTISLLMKVQDRVEEKLKSHELTKHLATKELVWFSVSFLETFYGLASYIVSVKMDTLIVFQLGSCSVGLCAAGVANHFPFENIFSHLSVSKLFPSYSYCLLRKLLQTIAFLFSVVFLALFFYLSVSALRFSVGICTAAKRRKSPSEMVIQAILVAKENVYTQTSKASHCTTLFFDTVWF